MCNLFRHDNNKTELYQFLEESVAQMSAGNMVNVTKGSAVLRLDNCTHKEDGSPYMPDMPQYMGEKTSHSKLMTQTC